ncbi:hypothetical protein AK812_SmicGene44191 [Symbiodinium microadriaticum]|uniref:Retrovirus-related Pol polyprotein from transposon TNT 1-94 n=1 Tax=Symbiodinium microadriaticum TaxID=2951 RepID=A0A1Q9BZ40_SYMMI|nr:hypothetical protein AK812_SmicGene44191 [Symbiodinium microadriaticum]CAE7408325.1 unnamed protein product [Symbiodinium sp. KB8]
MAAEGGLPASSISAPSTEEPQRPVLPGSITGGQGATMALGAAEAQRGVSPAVQATFSAGISGEQSHLFAPSPLPGGSPQDGIGAMTSRTQTWMSRLGDLFQQRRVEVHTAWTQSPTSNRRMDNPWVDQQPFTAPPERDLQREQNQTPPSTDSAPIPYELVQAEVSKQLEGAMSEVYKTMTHRLEVEKQRAEEAEQRAQQLRLQLEYMEQQAQGITQVKLELYLDARDRATAMMLTAIPNVLKEEVIAAGGVNTLNLMAKLFSTYQPGNRQEKALVLANLEKPNECYDAASAVEALRKWALWRRRAEAIGISEPDSSVLLQGLDRICNTVVKADAELAFRVSLIRSTLQVDVCPTQEAVTKFFQHLQAELEQQARLGVVKGAELQPRLKALGTSGDINTTAPPPPPSSTTPPKQPNQCKFFMGEKGCKRGKECRFPHGWNSFDKAERSRRCLICGAVGHKSRECKAPGGGQHVKPKDGPRTTAPKESAASPSSAPSSTSSSPSRRVGFENVNEAAMKVMSVLGEMKRIQPFQPLVDAVDKWAQRWTSGSTARKALMDSGATHPLRQPRSEKEWLDAISVNVALAGDAKTTMKQTTSGTLLSGDELTQVIVPLGRVIDKLGYSMRWNSSECYLERGPNERIPLSVVRGCPEVSESTAHQLIKELEQQEVPRLREATMESVKILRDVEVSWWSCMVDYVVNGDVQAGKEGLRYPNDGGWQSMKDAGMNRRTRKRLMQASTWIVRWDPPGFARKADVLQKVGRMSEVAYVNVGSLMALSNWGATWRVLLWAATQGRIGAVLTRDLAASTLEHEQHRYHRARVHFLHSLAAAGLTYKGCALPRLLIEKRRGAQMDSLDWMCDGKTQRYVEEMGLPEPMYAEDEAVIVVSGLTGIVYNKGFGRVRLARMSQDAAWRLHVMRNHQPFRRDCALCVRNAATGRQHRATMHPSGYCLSVDVAGPLKGYGRSPDGKFFRYFVIGAFRIPLLDGGVGKDGYVHGYEVPPETPDDAEEVLSEEEAEEDELEEEYAGPSRADTEKEKEEWRKLKESFRETTSTGSEPAENGVAEAGVRFLKRSHQWYWLTVTTHLLYHLRLWLRQKHLNTQQVIDLELNRHRRLVWVVEGHQGLEYLMKQLNTQEIDIELNRHRRLVWVPTKVLM